MHTFRSDSKKKIDLTVPHGARDKKRKQLEFDLNAQGPISPIIKMEDLLVSGQNKQFRRKMRSQAII